MGAVPNRGPERRGEGTSVCSPPPPARGRIGLFRPCSRTNDQTGGRDGTTTRPKQRVPTKNAARHRAAAEWIARAFDRTGSVPKRTPSGVNAIAPDIHAGRSRFNSIPSIQRFQCLRQRRRRACCSRCQLSAVGEGFEPPVPRRVLRFSRPVRSARLRHPTVFIHSHLVASEAEPSGTEPSGVHGPCRLAPPLR